MQSSKEKIYIVGHTKPDLDSVASAYGYAKYKQIQGSTKYIPIRCGTANPLTKWVFEKNDEPLPEYIPDISNLNVVLVDHTYPENRAKGWEKANILEVIDHHDVKLSDMTPTHLTIKLCGSTCTLITEKFVNSNTPIPTKTANILLSAILDDTLGLRSPTTIQLDIDMVNILNQICKIKDIWEYSNEIFSKKDIWNTLTPKETIEMDLKEIQIGNKRVAISQVETLNNKDIYIGGILKELKRMDSDIPLDLRLVMLTDLLKSNCILIAVGRDISLLEKELNTKIQNNTVVLPNVVSRKKQILPILEKMYKRI